MFCIVSSKIFKKSQAPYRGDMYDNFIDEIEDVEWEDDQEDPRGWTQLNEDNIDDYMADNEEPPLEEVHEEAQEDNFIDDPNQWEPLEDFGLDENVDYQYDDVMQLLTDAYNNRELISFGYTDRFGTFSNRSGVEVHGKYMPGTGQELIVTFDNSVGDIRTFTIERIHPGGIRHSGRVFQDDPRLMFDKNGFPLEGFTEVLA